MYYLVLGNLQCTVHDMKSKSELFGIHVTMIIVLIMNTVHNAREIKGPYFQAHSSVSALTN